MLPTQGSMAEPRRGKHDLGTYSETTAATRPQPEPGGVALAGGGGGLHCVADERRPITLWACQTVSPSSRRSIPGHAQKGREAPWQLLTLTVLQTCHARQFYLLWASFNLLTLIQHWLAVAVKSRWQQTRSGTHGRRPWQHCGAICGLPHEQEDAGLLPGGPSGMPAPGVTAQAFLIVNESCIPKFMSCRLRKIHA